MILQFLGQSRTGVGNFKTICESLTTTPRGVKTLVNFLSVEVNAILKLNEGSQLVAIAYSTLASKVATSNEITTVIIDNYIYFLFFIIVKYIVSDASYKPIRRIGRFEDYV